MMLLLQCRNVIRYICRRVVVFRKRHRYLIVIAMGAVIMLWAAADNAIPRDETYSTYTHNAFL